MRLTRRALLGAAAMVVTMGAAPAAAQVTPAQMLLTLDGLERACARKYLADRTLGLATPVVADDATPDTLLLTVLDFATVEDATATFETRLNGLAVRMLLGEPKLALEDSAVPGLGDRATLYAGVRERFDGPQQVAVLAAQDGELGILVEAWGPDAAMVETVEGIAAFAVAAAPGSGPVEVGELGATGGVFEVMPSGADAEVLRGLIPMYDYDLLLNGGDEPLGYRHEGDATPAG